MNAQRTNELRKPAVPWFGAKSVLARCDLAAFVHDPLRFFRAGRAVRDVRALRPEIARDQQALLAFDRCSGGEFTELAKGLAALESQLAEVGTQAGQLNLMLQDRDEDRALSSAFALHQKAVAVARTSIGFALSQGERMAQIESGLLQNRERFAQNRLKYRVLVMAIRAEAARIDPENRATFQSVADEIDHMQKQMSTVMEAAFLRLEEIVSEAAAGRVELGRLQGSIQQSAEQSSQQLGSALEHLQRNLGPCADANEHITQLLRETRSQTDELITSLQYQDIVRQQLDHVSLGLDDIAAHLGSAAPQRSVDLAYLHHAARVHRSHLGASRSAIEKAGCQIEDGSAALLKTGTELMTRFAQMEQAATVVFSGSQVHELFKRETDNLVEIANLCDATHQRICDLLNRIEQTVETLSSDVRRHELDVKLIALNSQIAAARVLNAGALNRLAEEISYQSAETASLTAAMGTQLGDALMRLRRIRDEDEKVQATIRRDKADIADCSASVSEKLNRLNGRLQHSSGKVAGDFGQAYQRVCDLLTALQFPAHIAETFAPAESFCDRLLAATERFGSADDLSTEGSDRLAAQHGRYTMREERDAHAAAVANGPAPALEATISAANNVELF